VNACCGKRSAENHLRRRRSPTRRPELPRTRRRDNRPGREVRSARRHVGTEIGRASATSVRVPGRFRSRVRPRRSSSKGACGVDLRGLAGRDDLVTRQHDAALGEVIRPARIDDESATAEMSPCESRVRRFAVAPLRRRGPDRPAAADERHAAFAASTSRWSPWRRSAMRRGPSRRGRWPIRRAPHVALRRRGRLITLVCRNLVGRQGRR